MDRPPEHLVVGITLVELSIYPLPCTHLSAWSEDSHLVIQPSSTHPPIHSLTHACSLSISSGGARTSEKERKKRRRKRRSRMKPSFSISRRRSSHLHSWLSSRNPLFILLGISPQTLTLDLSMHGWKKKVTRCSTISSVSSSPFLAQSSHGIKSPL